MIAALSMLACEPGEPSVRGPLVDLDAWASGPLDDDPLADHQPADPSCAPGGWEAEGGRLEIQTGICAYAWIVQESLGPLDVGEQLEVSVWHQGLDAAEPAKAHFALLVDDEVWWEIERPIPDDAGVFDGVVPVFHHVPEGARIGLHLHNHGYNSWSIGGVERWNEP